MNHPHSIREEHLIKEHCGFSGIMGYVTFHRKTRRGLSIVFLSHEKQPLSCFSQVKETAKCHKKDPHKNGLSWQRELKVFLKWKKLYDVLYVCMYLPFFKICCLVLCLFTYLFFYWECFFWEGWYFSYTSAFIIAHVCPGFIFKHKDLIPRKDLRSAQTLKIFHDRFSM